MFKISLIENAETAYKTALDSLLKILDGEGSYQNYRLYVLDLHSALELFFKKMLYDKSEFMMFSFKDFDSVMKKYENAKKASKPLFEYIATHGDSKAKLPNTVTFEEAYKRLAYLYDCQDIDQDFILKLERLNSLRNNITHFEISIEDDELVLLNDISLKCVELYTNEAEWGYMLDKQVESKIKDRNASIRHYVISDPFNQKILNCIIQGQTDGWVGEMSAEDYNDIARALIEEYKFDETEKNKIVQRLNIFYNLGFTEDNSATLGEYADASWFSVSKSCMKLLLERH